MRYLWLILFLLLLNGCSSSSNLHVSDYLQTENAKHIKNYYADIISLLLEYKVKLNKRNPNAYDKALANPILENIKASNNINMYSKKHEDFKDYKQYLDYAFSKESVDNRNDYLIIGIYKMFFLAYKMKNKHKITALDYDVDTFQKIYKNLQIISWKIKHNKNKNGEYLFLTWQNNWQVELSKKLITNKEYKLNEEEISYLKDKKESLLDPSNSSFEVIIEKMLMNLYLSIKLLGAEPEQIAVDAILNLTFLI